MGERVIFNGIVAYEKQHARLYNINEPDNSVTLYTPTNKCLSLLLEKRPNIISQSLFFEKVWQEEGISINTNTFYQHITMLRKAFEDVGLSKGDIITLPKQGLRLANTLEITCEDLAKPDLDGKEQAPSTLSLASEKKNMTPFMRWFFTYLSGMLIFCVFFGFSYWLYTKEDNKKNELDHYTFQGNIDNCQVSVLSPLSTLNDVKKELVSNGINCKVPENIYYATIPLLHRISIIACNNNVCRSYFLIKSR